MKRFLVAVALCLVAALGTPAGGEAVEKAPRTAVAAAVNINTASAAELEKLPGIGRVTAQNIVTYRNQHGKFAAPGDLVKVKGVGPKTLDKVRGKVVVK